MNIYYTDNDFSNLKIRKSNLVCIVCSAWQFYRTHLETNENHCQMCISISPIGLFFGCSSNPISRGNFKHSLRVLLNLLLKSNLFLFHNWVIFIGIICESTQVFFLQNFLSLLSTFFFQLKSGGGRIFVEKILILDFGKQKIIRLNNKQ